MKHQLILGGFLALSGAAFSQVSYNKNDVPIGGVNNVGFGAGILTINTSGNHNTGIGNYALQANTAGYYNSACGLNALAANSTGFYNTAIGGAALYQNTTGNDNTAAGLQALRNNNSGSENCAFGSSALHNNNASNNTAIGVRALFTNVTGVYNTSGGWESLTNNTSGSYNVAWGSRALHMNSTASGNTAVGHLALTNSNAMHNSAFGNSALYWNTSGVRNCAFGVGAMSNTQGSGNTGMGVDALAVSSTGNDNTAMGRQAMTPVNNGNNNTAVGAYANSGINNNGTNNTFLGAYSDVTAGGYNNATALGSGALVNASNRIWLGNNAVVDIWSNGTGYITASDQRFKSSVKADDVKGLEFIKLLRPVVYNFEAKKMAEFMSRNLPDSARKNYLEQDFSKLANIRQTGFLAQEVEAAAKKAGYDFSGVSKPDSDEDIYGISYATFVVPLVKAVQEQQQMIEKQEATVAAQQQQIDELKALVASLAGQPVKSTAVPVTLAGNVVLLGQNVPNPFAQSTVINYSIPGDYSSAKIIFSTTEGRVVKTVELSAAKGSLSVFAEDLGKGLYTYSLVVDGKILETKKMVKE